MMVFLAECGGQKWLDRLRRNGWGRMWARDNVRRWDEYPDEPYAFDNGAFSAWWNKKQWDELQFWTRFEQALSVGTPHFCVVPDKPAEGNDSLAFSISWRGKLGNECPYYLALQDGMNPDNVGRVCEMFDGLFLGGTDRFKYDTAQLYSNMAHRNGLQFHYARCGTVNKLKHAMRVGADSIDSSTPVQNGDAVYNEFEAVATGTHPQMELINA